MPAILNWLLRLLPTNPICMRLVQGGSRRLRHLYIRSGYLAAMIVVLLFVLLSQIGGGLSMRSLASAGATIFESVSYLQLGLICLLTPVFMAGAIAQEANPKTWDIMLTTPLNSLQVVLGNLFGRLFFILALLFSSLPLFAVTQFFGGVPGDSIFASYAIAGSSSLLVAAIAVLLSVTRTAGRRAVFVFYITVISYLFVTYAIDLSLRAPVAIGSNASKTTFMTPLNPFLALEVLLNSNLYIPHDPIEWAAKPWFIAIWFTRPIATFCWLCVLISVFLIAFSTLRLRVIGAKTGTIPWYRRMFGLGAKGASERPPRTVSKHPIAWRESTARGKTLPAILARWGFLVGGVILALGLVIMYHAGVWTPAKFQLAVASVVSAEIVILTLAAINMSATAVSREREDGTLDIILTTPIEPGPYITGKLRGLIQYLVPMILVPVLTMLIISIYIWADGLGNSAGVTISAPVAGTTSTITVPIVLAEGAIAMPIMLAPFIAFCVMIGLHWSIKSKGTIGSVIAAVAIVIAVVGVLSLCAIPAGQNLSYLGSVLATFSPINMLFALVYPAQTIPDALGDGIGGARLSIIIGALISAVVYSLVVYGLHTNMKRTFMMTVRKLSGTN